MDDGVDRRGIADRRRCRLMRLWSLHPALLDRQGLTAAWREALLAQAVLAGNTKGYRTHPQLERFRGHAEPLAAIGAFLDALQQEATVRGYRYDASKILVRSEVSAIEVTDGQLELELAHLRAKLSVRSPERLALAASARPHPLFTVVSGPSASWERAAPLAG